MPSESTKLQRSIITVTLYLVDKMRPEIIFQTKPVDESRPFTYLLMGYIISIHISELYIINFQSPMFHPTQITLVHTKCNP